MKDAHHILNFEREWTVRPEAKALRNTHALIPRIGREAVHNVIHANCPAVPVPSYHSLIRINREFEPTFDTLESIDNLLFAIDIASKNPKAHTIEKSLSILTMQSVEMQRPYLREALQPMPTVIDFGAL